MLILHQLQRCMHITLRNNVKKEYRVYLQNIHFKIFQKKSVGIIPTLSNLFIFIFLLRNTDFKHFIPVFTCHKEGFCFRIVSHTIQNI